MQQLEQIKKKWEDNWKAIRTPDSPKETQQMNEYVKGCAMKSYMKTGDKNLLKVVDNLHCN